MSGGGRKRTDGRLEPHRGRRASLPYRNVVDLAKALCKTCRQRRASYAAGVVIALPGIIQTLQPEDRGSHGSCEPSASSSPRPPQIGEHSRSGSGGSWASGMAPSAASAASLASSGSSGSSGMDDAGNARSLGPAVVQREDILVLTHDVRAFKEALGRLRKAFGPGAREQQRRETRLVAAHERLGQVLRVLRSILEKYPPIQSTELLVAAGTLIQHVKGHDYSEDRAGQCESFFEAVDQLALAFSSRVSEYLMGDLDTGTGAMGKTRSCENLLSPERYTTGQKYVSSALTGQEADAKLMRLSEGVEFSLRRAKVWSKYAKDVMTYVEKRACLEAEHARNLLKLAQTMRPVLKEESFLPFQSIYCTAIDQDLDNASACLSNCTLLQDHKFVEPLSARRNEHEKARKQIKEHWNRELKRMQELETNVRKSRALYIQRQQEHEKAKESAHRAAEDEGGRSERKRRLEDDALQKARDAETTYKACVVEANERLLALERTKAELLQQVRELLCQCDQTMKAVTVAYFQLQHTVSAPAPIQFQTLCESSRLYEPGSQYMEFVRRIPLGNPREPQLLTFEPYSARTDTRALHQTVGPLDHAALDLSLEPGAGAKTWGTGSDSDSVGSSNKSADTSPTASPQAPTRTLLTVSSGDDLDTDHDNDSGLGLCRRMCLSRAAETHSFRKLRTPSRCRECDSYVYFQGVECSECGLSSHKKCLETLAIRCGHKRLPRKMTTFGVDLTDHTDDKDVPYIVRKCVEEIDRRGYAVKGVYRVSGVKSKVEKLCQCFENGAQLVDLSEAHPNVVANVLKLYLRQLPEPLLTYRLYPHFVALAREHPASSVEPGAPVGGQEAVEDLRCLVGQLPSVHRRTLSLLLHHLSRVAAHAQQNHMPASNLAIVFGPTLLRTSEGSASLSSLVDTVHQTRVIELLITYVDHIFEDSEDDCTVLEAITRKEESSNPTEENQYLAASHDVEHSTAGHSPGEQGTLDDIKDSGDAPSCPDEAQENWTPVPPPRRGTSSLRGRSARGEAAAMPEKQESQGLTGPQQKKVAELRRQFFESTRSSVEVQQRGQHAAISRLLVATRTSSEPLLAGPPSLNLPRTTESREASGLCGMESHRDDDLWKQASSSHLEEPHDVAPRRAHSPLRESVSLKKHWYSTDEGTIQQESCMSWGTSGTESSLGSDDGSGRGSPPGTTLV